MLGWHTVKRRRLERKRTQRLLTKMQKAKVLDRKDDVVARPTWNKRFGFVAQLRAASK